MENAEVQGLISNNVLLVQDFATRARALLILIIVDVIARIG